MMNILKLVSGEQQGLTGLMSMVKHRPRATDWFGAFSKFPWRKFGQNTMSIFESCNNVPRGARGKVITSIIEHTRMFTLKWLNNWWVECEP